jgi:DNA-binding NarL/FixJ family response regulator
MAQAKKQTKKITERPKGNGKRLTLSEKLLIKAEREAGKSTTAIAKEYGVSHSTVSILSRDERFNLLKDQVDVIKNNMIDKFYIAADYGVERCVEAMPKASAQQAAVSAGIMIEKARLLENKTTQNQPVQVYLNIINRIEY